MVLTADQDGPGRVTSGNRAIAIVVIKTFEPSVLELRKEFVVLNSRSRVLEHAFHSRAQVDVGPFVRHPVWKNCFLAQDGNGEQQKKKHAKQKVVGHVHFHLTSMGNGNETQMRSPGR
jgi:hypothetical protein